MRQAEAIQHKLPEIMVQFIFRGPKYLFRYHSPKITEQKNLSVYLQLTTNHLIAAVQERPHTL
jgi:hypothetical protein